MAGATAVRTGRPVVRRPPRRRAARRRVALLAALVVVAVGGGVVGTVLHGSAAATGADDGAATQAVSTPDPTAEVAAPADGTITAADGLLPAGVTPSDSRYPGITNLRPDLLAALRRAAAASTAAGVPLEVTSGWRSAAYQSELLRQAVGTYGSAAAAARWVAPPTTSSHVSGSAVDVGPAAAATWLARHGAAYGLCETYRNEPWHYELRPLAAKQGCPAMYAHPTQDPRLRR